MALQFFRKHRRWGNVLLLAAMFAMVTFGALMYAGDAWAVVKGWFTGENPNNPTVLVVYGEKVTWRERGEVGANLERGVKFYQLCQQLPQGGMLMRSLMSYRAFQYMGAANSGEKNAARDVVNATVVLLREARDAGVVVTDQEIRNSILAGWDLAGVKKGGLRDGIVREVFEGRESNLFSMLRQELTLAKYYRIVQQRAKIVESDIWATYRNQNEKATILQADLPASLFRSEVEPASDEAIAAHFDKYKDVLPDDPEQPFGYKVPPRIQFEYLKVDAGAIRDELTISDKEIEDYYEANKDKLYLKPEDLKEELKVDPKADDPAKPTDPKADEKADPKAEGDKPAAPADVPAPDKPAEGEAADGDMQPANTMDAPDEQPETPTAKPAVDAPAVDDAPADAPKTDVTPAKDEPAKDDAAATVEKPKKEYKPLDDVREDIRKTLLKRKAGEKAAELVKEKLRALLRAPYRLKLGDVADDKQHVVVYRAKDYLTAEQVAKVPGIGLATLPMDIRQQVTSVPRFADVAFRVEGLVEKPQLLLNQVPNLVLGDFLGNRYLFVVTGVKEAEVPTLDAVRSRVVRDLREIAAYGKAELAAGKLIEDARTEGHSRALDAACKRLKMKAVNAVSKVVNRNRLGSTAMPNEVTKLVFEVLDDGGRFGTVPDKNYKKAIAFQIVKTELTPKSEFMKDAEQTMAMATQEAASEFFQEFIKTEEVLRRSGLKRIKLPDEDDDDDEDKEDKED